MKSAKSSGTMNKLDIAVAAALVFAALVSAGCGSLPSFSE